MSFDLRVESRFKNAVLYNAIYERFAKLAEQNRAAVTGNAPVVSTAAEAIGVPRETLYQYIGLRKSPYYKGRPLKSASRIAEYLQRPVEDLFPPSVYRLKLPKVVIREFDSVQVLSLQQASKEAICWPQQVEIQEGIQRALDNLSSKHREVIERRFGLRGEEQSMREVGEHLGVSAARVSQLEARALRHLRHPSTSRPLRELLLDRVSPSAV